MSRTIGLQFPEKPKGKPEEVKTPEKPKGKPENKE